MKKILPLLFSMCFSLFFLKNINAQCDVPTPGCGFCTVPVTVNNGGMSTGPLPMNPSNAWGCVGPFQIDNEMYVSFIAYANCVDFTVDAFNCSGSPGFRGIQAAIMSSPITTSSPTPALDCDARCGNQTNPPAFTVASCGLTIGDQYYLMIDGCFGSVCDITIDGNGISIAASITPDPVGPFCTGDPITTLTGIPATGFAGTGVWSGDVSSTGDIDPGTLGPGNYTADYTFTDNNGCSDVASISFTVNGGPPIALTPAGPFCENDNPVNLIFSPPGGTWTGPVSGGVFTPATAGAGDHNITYEVDVSGCISDTMITITVLPAPSITIDPIPDLCADASSYTIIFSPTGGTWVGDVGANGEIDPSVLGSGSFSGQYTFVDANGCEDVENAVFTINSLPSVIITTTGPFCENDGSINLSGNPSGGTWGGAAGSGGSFDPSSVGVGTHNVTYEFTDGNGCSDMTDVDIVVNAAPIISITPAGPFCENDLPVVISATPPNGTWSGPIASDGTFDPSSAGAGLNTVTYTFTNSDNCTESDDLEITVNAVPIVSIDPIPDICTNDGSTAATATPTGGTWTGDIGAGGNIDPVSLGQGSFTGTYTYTDGNGCMGSDNVTFNIFTSPVVTLDPAGPFCENDAAVNLVFSPTGGTWTGAPGGVFDPVAAGPGSHQVDYEVTNGVCTETATITIDVNAVTTPTIIDPGAICIDAGITSLAATPLGGTWGGAANSNGEIDPTALGVGSHQVTYTFTNGDNCTDDTDIIIDIVPLPIVMIDPQPPVCENDGYTTLNGTPGGGSWTGDVDGSGGFDPITLGPGTYSGTYTYTDGDGCMDDEMISFVINPAPIVDITPVDPQCESGAAVQVSATPPNGNWNGPISNTGVFDPVIAGPGTHTITYTFINSFGCTDDEMIDIEVVGDPIIDFLSPDEYCASDDPVVLDASPFGGDWGGDADINGNFDPATLGPGTYSVTYTYTDPIAGCTAVLTQQITVLPGATLSFSNTGPFCEDVGNQFIIADPAGGDWGGVSFFGGEIVPDLTGVGVHDITYEYTDANGCFVDTVFQIEILELPFAQIDPIGDLCPYDASVQLTASPSGGDWGGAADASGIVDPVALGGGDHLVSYTVTGTNGCINVAEYYVEINEEFDIFFINTGPFCLKNEIQTLDADPFGGDWNGAVDFRGEFNPINLGIGTHTAYYNYFYGSNCEQTDSIEFEILDPGNVTFGDSVFCQNTGNQTLVGTPAGGTWSGSGVTASGQINTDALPIGNFTVVYTIPQAGGSCDVVADLEIEIQGITATIVGDTIFCQTADTVNFVGTPIGGVWSGVANNLGNVIPAVLTVGAHTVSYTATSTTGCMTTINQIINVTAPPTATISGTGTICPGGNATTDLIIMLTGNSPWQVNYNLDTIAQVPITITTSPFTLTASQAGDYTLTGVTDASGCLNTASGTATVTELSPLSVTNILSQCNGTNTGFVISFEISGGDPASYSVAGLTGMVSSTAPYIFTSQNIPTGTPVNFTVSDNSGCAPVSESLTVDCSCETEVGTMDSNPIDICGTGTAMATYDPTGQSLDADDLVQYVLHTNAGISLGTVLGTSNSPSFDFDASTMMFGTTYYISGIAGSNDGSGNVDLTDNCLKVAQGTPVTWRENPTAMLSGGAPICTDSTGTMQINLTGQSPWFVRYWNGTDTIDLNGITSSPFDLNVTPAATTTYELTEVRNNFCDGTANGTQTITVNESPTISTPTTQCDGTASNYTVTFTISGGDPASYIVSGLTGNLSGNTFTSDLITSGTGYTVSVSDANGCPPATFSDLIDCGCLTTVGTMDGTTLRICGDDPAIAVYDNTNEFLDADDIVLWYLHTNSDNTIGTIIATNTIPEFTFDASQMMYGTTYYISAAAGTDTGGGAIDLNDNCTDISVGTPVVFQLEPTAILTGDATICEGVDTTLTITLTGAAPWAIVYNDGTNDRNLTVPSSPFTIDISPLQNTTYSLVSVRDGNCPGDVSGSVTVMIVSPPSVDNLITECNIDKTEYTVRFDIIGGDPATYNVDGNAGILTAGSFVSNPIPAGDGYSFSITDGNNCGQIDISAQNVRCDCETDAGTVQSDPLEACVNETVEAFHNSDAFLDVNDTLMFALHDGSANFLGNVITLNSGTTFGFDASQMMAGTRYFISAIAGNIDAGTGINLSDPCLSVSTGVAVTFHALPTVLIMSDQNICEGDEAVLTLDMTGRPPFNVTVSDGSAFFDLIGITTGFEYKFTPTENTTISILNISDENGCQNTSMSEAVVTVNTPPTATLSNADICNTTQNNNIAMLDFAGLITDGDATGTWNDLDGSGAMGTFPMLDFEGVAPGQYRFEYRTATAVAPCVDATYEITITVSDCSCPSVATSPAGPFCADDAELDLATITTTAEAGSWEITNSPAGSTATIAGNVFRASGSTDGDYELTFTLDQTPDAGCPENSVQTIRVIAPPTADITPIAQICNTDQSGDLTAFDFTTLITGGDTGGTWENVDGVAATGTLPNLDFVGITPGDYRFRYTTASAEMPCAEQSYEITLTVRDCACPSVVTAPAGPFCADDAELDLGTITSTTEAGSWTITNSPAGSTATIAGNVFRASGSTDGDYELTFTLDQMPDAGCPESSTQTIRVIAPPTADVTPIAQICNTNQSGEPTAFDFSTLITSGDTGGAWENVDGITAMGTLPNLDFDGITPGDYRFRYTTASAEMPCAEQSYEITLTVRDCACPSVVTAPAGPFCTDAAELDLTTITTTTESGTWTITNAPSGSTAEIAGSTFRASGSVDGTYELTFTLDSPVAGCPENSVQTITLVPPPTADVTPGAEVCNVDLLGDPTTFDFSTLVIGGDTGGSWQDVDNSGATGTFPTLDFAGITVGQYTFRYTTFSALRPCVEQTYDVTLTVRDCSCPSVTTAPAGPFCNDAATLDLTTITVTTEAGSWAISNAPAGSTATITNNTFNATGSSGGDYELTYTLSQTPPAGCDNSSTQVIQISQAVSAGTASGTLRICNDGTDLNLNDELTGASPGGSWNDLSATPVGSLFNGGVLTTQNLPNGTYVFEYVVTTTAPCINDSETITVEIDNPVNSGDLIQNLNLCEGLDSTINLFDLIENNDLGGVWTDVSATGAPSFNANGTISTTGLANGTYRFQYTLIAGGICPNDEITVEIQMNEQPTADAGETFELTCDIRTATIGGTNSSSGQNINYQWLGSTTINDPRAAMTTVREAATYTLRVTDTQSGCFEEDQVIISEQGSLPILNANSIEITCFGDNDGEIMIDNVDGGVPPYMYSLNDGAFSSDATFRNLEPGDYTLVVEDATGCQDRLTFTIDEPEELTVTLTTNLAANSNLIQQGDSIQLQANISGSFDSIQWSPPESFEPCDPETDPLGCITPWVSPDRITTYDVFVIDEKGCSDRSSVTVFVEKVRNVFIPSAFSPNDDGINDEFQVFTDPNVEEIKSFLIFDRWGNLVFEHSDFSPDDPSGRWDGRYRGNRMDPAVFAYFVQVEFKDGTIELFEGDVSLLK